MSGPLSFKCKQHTIHDPRGPAKYNYIMMLTSCRHYLHNCSHVYWWRHACVRCCVSYLVHSTLNMCQCWHLLNISRYHQNVILMQSFGTLVQFLSKRRLLSSFEPWIHTLAGPGGAHPARAPLTAADLWFFVPKTLFFLKFFLARFARD